MKALVIHFCTQSGWFKQSIDEFVDKINPFIAIEVVCLDSSKKDRKQKEQKIDFETKKILGSLKKDDYVVVLDERGSSFDSKNFSKKIETALLSSKKRVVFIIGGPYGISPEVKDQAQLCLSLSLLTMNQKVALTVLLEQIYRSLTIIRNFPYHND